MKGTSAEFSAMIGPDGTIAVPEEILGKIGKGARLRVRLTGVALASVLDARGVDARELDRIAELQRESQEQVIAFLLSEGALAPRGKRARGARRGKR